MPRRCLLCAKLTKSFRDYMRDVVPDKKVIENLYTIVTIAAQSFSRGGQGKVSDARRGLQRAVT